MKKGTFSTLKGKFVDVSTPSNMEGTLISAPINFHTHLGDSFIGTEPEGDIEDIVGPGGFKIRALDEAKPSLIKSYIVKSVDFMRERGTAAFFDFRESGIKGLRLAPRLDGITGFFLTRPNTPQEIGPLIDRSAGFGMSVEINGCTYQRPFHVGGRGNIYKFPLQCAERSFFHPVHQNSGNTFRIPLNSRPYIYSPETVMFDPMDD